MLGGDVFERLNALGEEGIRNLRDNQTKNAGLARNECASLSVGVIAEFLYQLPNTLSKSRIDSRNAVNGTRNGGDGNFGSLGDFSNAHSSQP